MAFRPLEVTNFEDGHGLLFNSILLSVPVIFNFLTREILNELKRPQGKRI